MRLRLLFVVVPLALSSASARANDSQTPDAPVAPAEERDANGSVPPSEGEELRAAIARQGAQIAALRADLDAERRAREHPPIRLSGFIQVDWVVHNQASQNQINDSNGTLLNEDRFTLRRGHLRADADYGPLSGALEVDLNTTHGLQVRPIDAEVSAHWPERPIERLPSLALSAGLMRIPFGFEVQELDWVRPFLERATVLQALFPSEFDLGAALRLRYRFLDWAIAAMNGSPIGSGAFPALDPVHEKDLVGRIGVDVMLERGVRLRAGVSADAGTGFHAGTPTTKDVVVWQDANGDGVVQPNEVTVIPGSAATPSQTFRRFALGGDAELWLDVPALGELAFRAEIVNASNLDRGVELADPVGAGHDLREFGWALGATQEITRWAEVGVRYDRYNPDADANTQRGASLVPVDRSYGTLALVGMAKHGYQRLLVEYDLRTNPLGIAPSGAPTTLAENALTIRAQGVF
jgi:hypothetical protein